MGESHAGKRVLTTFFWIAGHGKTPLANSFPTQTWESIPKGVFFVNRAVVRCNKKPGPPVRLAGFLSGSGSGADCGSQMQ